MVSYYQWSNIKEQLIDVLILIVVDNGLVHAMKMGYLAIDLS